MRYQKAKRIVEILPLLYANDKETVLLGITLLKNEPLIANLNKHYKKLVKLEWPGFSSESPEKFKTFQRANAKVEFSKKVLDYMFNMVDDDYHFNMHTLGIICWISSYCGWGRLYRKPRKYAHVSGLGCEKIIRNKNYNNLFHDCFYNRHPDDQLPESGKDYSQCAKKQKIFKIKRHTKRPWQDNRKYNARYPMSYRDYIEFLDNKISHNLSMSKVV